MNGKYFVLGLFVLLLASTSFAQRYEIASQRMIPDPLILTGDSKSYKSAVIYIKLKNTGDDIAGVRLTDFTTDLPGTYSRVTTNYVYIGVISAGDISREGIIPLSVQQDVPDGDYKISFKIRDNDNALGEDYSLTITVGEGDAVECGNGKCEEGETQQSCPQDCGQPTECGNGICENGETQQSCPQDCGQPTECGNGICENGETEDDCPQDCKQIECGDGVCDEGEDEDSCYADCHIVQCGDGICDEEEDEKSCEQDCKKIECGDGVCDEGETEDSCYTDCHVIRCGDGKCEGDETEATCYTDCHIITCGDGKCEGDENKTSCPADCKTAVCGDGVCELDETQTNCQEDCAVSTCDSDGTCESDQGETEKTCPADCKTTVCGDGKCELDEDQTSCPQDCRQPMCGDGRCELGETVDSCYVDCYKSVCGNGKCEPDENKTSCPADCITAVCGDGICENGETSESCPQDCRQIQCGDGRCEGNETQTCPQDCVGSVCGNGLCEPDETVVSCAIDCAASYCGNGVCEPDESSDTCPQDCQGQPATCGKDFEISSVTFLDEPDAQIGPTDKVALGIYLKSLSALTLRNIKAEVKEDLPNVEFTSSIYNYNDMKGQAVKQGYYVVETNNMEPSTYQFNLLVEYIKSTQVCRLTLPFNLEISPGVGVAVEVTPDTVETDPKKMVTLTVNIRNMGREEDRYTLLFRGVSNWVQEFERVVSVPSGESRNTEVKVYVPEVEGIYQLTVEAKSQSLTSVSDKDTTYLVVTSPLVSAHAIQVSADKVSADVAPGTSTSFMLRVQNKGVMKEAVVLSVDGPDYAYLNPKTLELEPGETKEVELYVAPDSTVSQGTADIMVTARTSDNMASDQEKLSVYVSSEVEMEPELPEVKPKPAPGFAGYVGLADLKANTLNMLIFLESMVIIGLSYSILKKRERPEELI